MKYLYFIYFLQCCFIVFFELKKKKTQLKVHDFTIHFVDFCFAFIIFFGTSRTLYDIPKTAANETEVMGSNPRSMPFVFKPLHASNTGNLPQKDHLSLSIKLTLACP